MDERQGGLRPEGTRPEAVLWHLRWRLRAAWLAVLAERAGRALWPALTIGAAVAGAVLLGLARGLSQGALWLAAGVAALSASVPLDVARPLRSPEEIVARIFASMVQASDTPAPTQPMRTQRRSNAREGPNGG